ncbi:unnamed protein product [Owenia fusiformis]|uniref:C2H2-type domain-containing protein n=1 Tax=Owenia fusiformis TaxID=6347 RepID=A0A8S4Q309_OWEFU|nr:unnamed protein product [Owenia fusiformis]
MEIDDDVSLNQQGGALYDSADMNDYYSLIEVQQKHSAYFNANSTAYTLELFPPEEINNDIAKILQFFDALMTDIIHTVMLTYDGNDRVRFMMDSVNLLAPITTGFITKDNLTSGRVLDAIERVCQSKMDIFGDEMFTLYVDVIRAPLGGYFKSSKSTKPLDHDSWMANSKCIIPAKNFQTEICFGAALAIAKAKSDLKSGLIDMFSYRRIRDNKCDMQETKALELYKKAGVPVGACDFSTYDKFMNIPELNDYQLKIIAGDNLFLKEIYCRGPNVGLIQDKALALYLRNGHYSVITSLIAFYRCKSYCYSCNKALQIPLSRHRCLAHCPLCESKSGCKNKKPDYKLCSFCNIAFLNATCYDNHIVSLQNVNHIISFTIIKNKIN